MKNIKIIISISVLIIVFLISAFFLFGLTKNQSVSVQYYYFNEQYPLKVSVKSEDSLTQICRQDDVFEVDGFENIPINHIFCSEIFKLMKQLEIKGVFKPEHDLKHYGLDEPRVKIKADFDDHSAILRIGNIAPDGTACYCLEEGKQEIGLIPVAKIDPFFREHFRYINLNLIPYIAKVSDENGNLIKGKVKKCVIKRSDLDSPIELVADHNGKLKTSDPKKFEIPEETMLQLENGPPLLTASGLYTQHLSDEILELCGLRNPQVEVTYVVDDKTYSLKIGGVSNLPKTSQPWGEHASENKNLIYRSYYMMMDDIPAIYTIAESSLPWLNMRFK